MTANLIEITDALIASDAVRMGQRLAGQIREEVAIGLTDLQPSGFNDLVTTMANRYVRENHQLATDATHVLSRLVTAWTVSQRENEYNPVHNHSFCQLSGVAYLKMPAREQERVPGKPPTDGDIQFIHGSSGGIDQMSAAIWTLHPEAGDVVLFPSSLLHTVYPFRGEQERRSVAFNLVYRVVDAVTGLQLAGDSSNHYNAAIAR